MEKTSLKKGEILNANFDNMEKSIFSPTNPQSEMSFKNKPLGICGISITK